MSTTTELKRDFEAWNAQQPSSYKLEWIEEKGVYVWSSTQCAFEAYCAGRSAAHGEPSLSDMLNVALERANRAEAEIDVLRSRITELQPQCKAGSAEWVSEREEFERWNIESGAHKSFHSKDDSGRYESPYTSARWEAWQARAALQHTAPAPSNEAILDKAISIVRQARDSIGAGGLAEQAQYERQVVGPYLDGIEDELRELLTDKPEPRKAGERTDEQIAQAFHEAYERLAPAFSYETREEVRALLSSATAQDGGGNNERGGGDNARNQPRTRMDAGSSMVANSAQAAQSEDAKRCEVLEQTNDRLCDRLVIAQKHMTSAQREAFEAEWTAFMSTTQKEQ